MDTDGTVEYPTPTLMRSARGVYARSIRAQLNAIGIDDLPKNGAFVLAGIDESGGPRNDLPSELGVTKQAVSQVVDILVVRGYLDRRPDTDDRRRIALDLTDSGRQAVEAVGGESRRSTTSCESACRKSRSKRCDQSSWRWRRSKPRAS